MEVGRAVDASCKPARMTDGLGMLMMQVSWMCVGVDRWGVWIRVTIRKQNVAGMGRVGNRTFGRVNYDRERDIVRASKIILCFSDSRLCSMVRMVRVCMRR